MYRSRKKIFVSNFSDTFGLTIEVGRNVFPGVPANHTINIAAPLGPLYIKLSSGTKNISVMFANDKSIFDTETTKLTTSTMLSTLPKSKPGNPQ